MRGVMRFEVYKDAGGEYRWRASAANGRIVADSAEGYKRRWGASNAAVRFVAEVGQMDTNGRWLTDAAAK